MKTFRSAAALDIPPFKPASDSATATLDLASGVHGMIDVSSVRHPDHSTYVSVSGKDGRLDLSISFKDDQVMKSLAESWVSSLLSWNVIVAGLPRGRTTSLARAAL